MSAASPSETAHAGQQNGGPQRRRSSGQPHELKNQQTLNNAPQIPVDPPLHLAALPAPDPGYQSSTTASVSPMENTIPSTSANSQAGALPSTFETARTTTLLQFLTALSLPQYHQAFVSEGFTDIVTLCDVTEDDFEALGVKRGHRRLIQREIAALRGRDRNLALQVDGSTPGHGLIEDDGRSTTSGETGGLPRHLPSSSMTPLPSSSHETPDIATVTHTSDQVAQPQAKRKYRRHPKPDPHAPEKPPSAYVTFSNEVREDVKDKSFTEIARIVGERWKSLDEDKKAIYEGNAARAKENWLIQMNEYKRTADYARHQEYIKEFRTRHPKESKKLKPASTGPVPSSSLSRDASIVEVSSQPSWPGIGRPRMNTNSPPSASPPADGNDRAKRTRLDSTSYNRPTSPMFDQSTPILPPVNMLPNSHAGLGYPQYPLASSNWVDPTRHSPVNQAQALMPVGGPQLINRWPSHGLHPYSPPLSTGPNSSILSSDRSTLPPILPNHQ